MKHPDFWTTTFYDNTRTPDLAEVVTLRSCTRERAQAILGYWRDLQTAWGWAIIHDADGVLVAYKGDVTRTIVQAAPTGA